MPAKHDPAGSGGIEGRTGKPKGGENVRAEPEHGRRNKTRANSRRASLARSLALLFFHFSFPRYPRRLAPRTSHPGPVFPLFTFIWIFLAAGDPSSSRHSSGERARGRTLAQTCRTGPPYVSPPSSLLPPPSSSSSSPLTALLLSLARSLVVSSLFFLPLCRASATIQRF